MRDWCSEITGHPSWLFDECYFILLATFLFSLCYYQKQKKKDHNNKSLLSYYLEQFGIP